MTKINDLLNTLENSAINAEAFAESRIRIGDELYRIVDSSEEESDLHKLASKMYVSWAQLGGYYGDTSKRTLTGYLEKISELKAFIHSYENEDL